jgi:hypothetical protein
MEDVVIDIKADKYQMESKLKDSESDAKVEFAGNKVFYIIINTK